MQHFEFSFEGHQVGCDIVDVFVGINGEKVEVRLPAVHYGIRGGL